MSNTNIYDVGDQVTLTGRFYSDAALTTPADPTTITVSVRDPSRVVTAVVYPAAGMAKTSTGVYTYAFPVTLAGWHEVNWTGTGAVVSADQEGFFVKVGISLGARYLELDQLKSTLTMNGTTFADADLTLAIGAASRAVDSATGRRFWLDTGTANVRYYTPRSYRVLQIDDLVTLGTAPAVAIDRSGTGTYSETWTLNTDFVLEPFNAPQEQPARPYETLRVRATSGRYLPMWIEKSVQVTAQFGWSSVPDDVAQATGILASKLLLRARSAPFGIATAGGIDGSAMRIARTDPDVYTLLKDYNRHEIIV